MAISSSPTVAIKRNGYIVRRFGSAKAAIADLIRTKDELFSTGDLDSFQMESRSPRTGMLIKVYSRKSDNVYFVKNIKGDIWTMVNL